MFYVIVSIAIFCAFLLILVILAQNPKGGGLSSQFGGSNASNMIGVKKTGDLLEKLTWGFAVAIMVLAIISSKVGNISGSGETQDYIFDKAKEQQGSPAAPATRKEQDTSPVVLDSTAKE